MQEIFIKMALDAWNSYLKRTDELFDTLTEEQLMQPVCQGRNRGIYLLGHLTAIHDRMLPLLGFGDSRYPQMQDAYVVKPDGDQATADVEELKHRWKETNQLLAEHFSKLSPAEWFQRHQAVSEEDFKKEPHRNRLNLVINRTNHLAEHYGQLVFLKPRISPAG